MLHHRGDNRNRLKVVLRAFSILIGTEATGLLGGK